MNNLKRITLLVSLLLISIVSKSQSNIKTFDIINTESVSSSEIEIYKAIITEANLESYRNKTTRDTLSFENGIKIILYSAQELYIQGYSILPSNYVDVRDPRYTSPIFRFVVPSGMPQAPGQKPYLVALYNHIEK